MNTEEMTLNPDQVRLFRHNGFLKLPTPLPKETVAALKSTVLRDINGAIEPVARDVEGRVNRISKLAARHSIFLETAGSKEVIQPLKSLLGPNIELVRNRHNHATLNRATTRTDSFHRDVAQWTRSLVTVIFYLDASTFEKGSTVVIPGSHLLPGMDVLHNLDREPSIQEADILDQAVPVPMPAGGMLAINSLILHRIGTNTTTETRMSMTFGYHSADELSGNDEKRILISGERVYRGNDL
jgi:ectoine hydroxylase-related dioxygenase (phytanoyl-CoA dioxygenase family)